VTNDSVDDDTDVSHVDDDHVDDNGDGGNADTDDWQQWWLLLWLWIS